MAAENAKDEPIDPKMAFARKTCKSMKRNRKRTQLSRLDSSRPTVRGRRGMEGSNGLKPNAKTGSALKSTGLCVGHARKIDPSRDVTNKHAGADT